MSSSPPRKRPKKPLTVGEKEVILNIFKVSEETYPNNIKTENVNFTAKAAGVAVATVYNVLREYKTEHRLKPPAGYHRSRKILDNVDNDTKLAIANAVHSLAFLNEKPTINKVLEIINKNEELPIFKRSTMGTLMKELGLLSEKKAVVKVKNRMCGKNKKKATYKKIKQTEDPKT